jgi:hypothetical protein
MSLHPDYKDILAAFEKYGVEYLLVGGYAVAFHGRPRFTKDIDLWVKPTPENLANVRSALVDFGAPAQLLAELDDASPEDVLWMGTPPVRIDIVKGVPGGHFERAFADRVTSDWEGVRVSVVARKELIALKRASGRPQDLLDADLLERDP